MKNKTKTYLLLGAVLAIWGIIGFRIMSTLNPEAPEVLPQDNMVAFKPKTTIAVDTFSVQAVERDPFLGTLYAKKKTKTKRVKPKETLTWAPIVYHGAIAKQQSKTQVFVISINGQQHLMKIGQTIDEIKLVKANAKQITLRYKNERKTVDKI